ncbi:hypothetical protein CMO93_01745 [Candidatus Woesearchaeota archaeon]|nr:hypothetical protein [Candidatus Woesearchaeota archaeon]
MHQGLNRKRGRFYFSKAKGAATVGTALTNLENRATGAHKHTLLTTTYKVYPQHESATASVLKSVSMGELSSDGGTNAPYMQFLYCVKD